MMNDTMVTYFLIGITAITSIACFQNNELLNKLLFYPAEMKSKGGEYWRFLTHGLVHADVRHLVFNMLTLYFFGPIVENAFHYFFENVFVFPMFYIGALVFSSVPSYYKHKDNYYYRSLGASGAVSAVLFAGILFDPWMRINFIIPAILFAIAFIAYSSYMSKNGQDNIGHDSHLWGAVFGLICPIVLKHEIFFYFLEQLKNPRF